jgi:SAM-dependent methyltransferase
LSHGRWGGRFPLVNFLATNVLFAAARWRTVTRRCRNALRKGVVVTATHPGAAAALQAWLDQRYDRLNVGGGPKNLAGFINIDFVRHPGVQRQVVANILDLGFIPTGAVAHVHSNHVIEHLTEEQIEAQLREYRRILRPSGLLTLRCPNALGVAYGFWFEPILEGERDEFIRLGFPADEDLSASADRWAHKDLFATLHWFFGDVGNVENQHLTIVTPTKIRKALENAGFEILKAADPEALNIVIVARPRGKGVASDGALPL